MNRRAPATIAGIVKVKQESLDELHRVARQADRMASDIERLKKVQTAALVILVACDTDTLTQRHVEALRRALEGANQ